MGKRKLSEESKLRILNYFIIFICIIILLVGVFTIQYYFNQKKSLCLKDPIAYGIKEVEEKTDTTLFAFGSIINSEGATLRISLTNKGLKIEK